tara:strand:- start:3747 stop:3908 length:162 start_codon:yes stop_codon:yes gene_type:complete
VHLTEAGHALIVEAFAHHSENLNELFDVFTDEERVQFAELIRRIGQRAVSLKS